MQDAGRPDREWLEATRDAACSRHVMPLSAGDSNVPGIDAGRRGL